MFCSFFNCCGLMFVMWFQVTMFGGTDIQDRPIILATLCVLSVFCLTYMLCVTTVSWLCDIYVSLPFVLHWSIFLGAVQCSVLSRLTTFVNLFVLHCYKLYCFPLPIISYQNNPFKGIFDFYFPLQCWIRLVIVITTYTVYMRRSIFVQPWCLALIIKQKDHSVPVCATVEGS